MKQTPESPRGCVPRHRTRTVIMAPPRVFIVAAKRTPFGAFGGALKGHSATALCVHSTQAALAAGNVPADAVDSVTIGNVQQTSGDAAYMARHVALKSGMRIETPCLSINRLCGSGFEAVVTGARDIILGDAEVAVTAGSENMSQAPMSVYGQNCRWGTRLGLDLKLEDTLWAGLTDSHAKTPMGVTAENLAEDYGISRAESDAYAIQSQTRWAAAHAAGKFDAEIAPIELKGKKGPVTFDTDEHPKPQATVEKISKLPTTFKKDGVVSPASASGICDGAATLVLASEAAVDARGLCPLAELVSWASVGVEPSRMGIGPVPAIEAALGKAGLQVGDVGLYDINEAFAPQFLACAKALKLDLDRTNVCGGAIALGHPLGASGARITAHLAHAIARGDSDYAVGSACIGGGQGIALVLKKA